MPLGHFTNVTTATNMWEAVYKSLFEVSIILPPLLVANNSLGDGIKGILLENATSVPLPTYPKIDVKTQRFKYSTRTYKLILISIISHVFSDVEVLSRIDSCDLDEEVSYAANMKFTSKWK